jgi:hypothetical protein
MSWVEETLPQLVRRETEAMESWYQSLDQSRSKREGRLSKALFAVLSMNVFVLSGVLSFCLFVYYYPI